MLALVKKNIGVRAILILLVLIAIAPTLALIVQSSVSEQGRDLATAQANLAAHSQLTAVNEEQLFESVRHMLTAVAQGPLGREHPQVCNDYLRRIGASFPQFAMFGFADPAGNLVCRSSRDPRPIYIGDRLYFREAVRTGHFAVGEYMTSRLLGQPAVAFAVPVLGHDGQVKGVQYAIIEVAAFQRRLRERATSAEIADVVTDGAGVVLASAGAAGMEPGDLVGGFLKDAVRTRRAGAGSGTDGAGREWLYDLRFVDTRGPGVMVASMLPREKVLRPAMQRLQQDVAILAAIALLASAVAWWLGDRLLARPVSRIMGRLKALEDGDSEFAALPAPAARPVDELTRIEDGIADLAEALAERSAQRDVTLHELESQKNRLADSERRYRALFEASPQPMWIYDGDSLNFLAVNDAAVVHYGYSRAEFLAMKLPDLRLPEEVPQLIELLKQRGPTPQHHVRARHRRKNGDLIEVELARHGVEWEGRPARIVIVADITNRIEAERAWQRLNETLEREVQQRTADLQLANEELEAFSYSVSHDLRAPLHAIEGFSAALVQGHGAALEPKARHYLERIQAGTVQMNALIQSLLTFARTGRAPLEVRHVDLAQIAAGVAARLRERHPQREVALDIEAPLGARGDPHLLAVVFDNLLGNAWKFTAAACRAHVRVARVAAGAGEATFVVADNGAGFEMAYAARLFKPFQRLHGAAEFEGSGIGLAIVYRIVHRHGGRVWAESQPGEGARFFFTLPVG